MDTEQIISEMEKLFGDTSVSPEETLEKFEEIRDKAQEYIDAIESDLANADESESEEEEGEPQDD